jgi:hypothetical protein
MKGSNLILAQRYKPSANEHRKKTPKAVHIMPF